MWGRRNKNVGMALAFCLVLIAAFQNCTNGKSFSSEAQKLVGGHGNGNGYGGKPIYFEYFNPAQVCTTLTSSGAPFPTRQIFATAQGVTLVRDNCQDIEPIVIPPSQYSVDPLGQYITYQGQRFDVNADLSVYNKISPLCPGARAPNGAVVPNMLADPLNLFAWDQEQNVGVTLFGSIEALPRFRLEHLIAQENWWRIKQWTNIAANTDYAATILVSRGNTDLAYFTYWVDDGTGNTLYGFDIHIDIATGAVTYNNAPAFMNVSIKTQAYGAGRAITIFFRQPTAQPGSFGVSSTNGAVFASAGDYIYATAADVKPVDAYCSP